VKRHREAIAVISLFFADLLCLAAVTGAAIYVRFYSPLFPRTGMPPWPSLWGFIGLTPLALLPSLALSRGYQLPRRWTVNEALPTVTRALLLTVPTTTVFTFALRLGAVESGSVRTPSRIFVFTVWIGLYVGLVGVRLLMGRLHVALYRRGIGVRRTVILGDGERAAWLADRIQHSSWLGECPVGRVGESQGPDWLGYPRDLADVVRDHRVDVVWLVPPTSAVPNSWLPSLLFDSDDHGLIWRVLPAHFDQLFAANHSTLTQAQRELFLRRLRHDLALPTLRIAMLGSRGVPANYGGVERYVEQVGSYLAQNGAQVAVYCHAKYVSARGTYRGMELRFVPTIATKHLETIVHTFLATLHVLLHEDEIVHYQALGPSTMAWLPRVFGRKVVVTVQGLDWQRAKWGKAARLYLAFGEWASAHFPHRTIVVSQALFARYASKHGRQTTFIPNGFQPPKRMPPRLIKQWNLEKGSYILFVGRLVPEKGCHTLLRAFADVQTDKRLVFAGDASYEDSYRQQLGQMAQGVEGINFIGFVQDDVLRELYSNAYLVVHPSELEGLSISLLEAFSYGNCLLVSNVPENLEAVRDMGYRFQVGDSDDLARQMQWLLDHPDQVQATRTRVRSEALNAMDWEAVAKETQRLYGSLNPSLPTQTAR
jgi:glycosyltransferase involved in cell wall biosynthesis